MSSWFPIPESLVFGNAAWHGLTTNAKVMLLASMSQANLSNGMFLRTNDEWRVRLGGPSNPIALHTLLDARKALAPWVSVNPGSRAGLRSLASTYTVEPGLWSPPRIEGHWAQMRRYMFDDILHRMGRDAALAYTYLSIEFWRYRGRYADRKHFTIELGEMKTESGLREFYPLIERLYRDWKYKDKSHLFEFTGFRRIRFSQWQPASEDANAELEANRENDIRMRAERLTSDRNYMAGVGR